MYNSKYKPEDVVQYRHPYTNKILMDKIYQVHKEQIISKDEIQEYIWYEMYTYGDVHHVGNHVSESQIIRLLNGSTNTESSKSTSS